MSLLSLFALALGLAMDATAVAASRGLAVSHVRVRDAIRVGVLFGGAQALMPALGWLAGARFAERIRAWDHWVAFVLLGGIGVKMLFEARGHGDKVEAGEPFGWKLLVGLSVATSIDALAAGLTLPLLHVPFVTAIATIGFVTAALAFGGVYAGRQFGRRLGARLDALGGVVLIGMGTKILIEHLRGDGLRTPRPTRNRDRVARSRKTVLRRREPW